MLKFFKTRSPLALQSRSGKIVNIFTKTTESLKKVNDDADLSTEEKQKKKEKLEQELTALQVLKENNSKVITKIQQIFE